ncbi:MAG TPA: hypothetical protein VGL26_09175 [Jatrophihabitans sp.]
MHDRFGEHATEYLVLTEFAADLGRPADDVSLCARLVLAGTVYFCAGADGARHLG